MNFKSNLNEIISKLQQVANQAEALDFSEPLIAGLNAALGEMKFRVFNTGKDYKGTPFGIYTGKKSRVTNRKFKRLRYGDPEEEKDKSKKKKRLGKNADAGATYTEYEKFRLAHGRQVKFKDLELFGSLRRGLIVVKINETKAAISIPNEKLFKIAQYQNEQISRIIGKEIKIFSFSDSERKTNQDVSYELINQLYARLFNS